MSKIYLEGSSMDEFLKELCSKLKEVLKIQNKIEDIPREELFTRNEAAEFLKITLPTLSRWTRLNYLRAYNIGSRVYYKKSEILCYLDTNSNSDAA